MRLLVTLALTLLAAGCRTTAGRDEGASEAAAVAAAATAGAGGFGSTLELGKTEEQALYLKMLAVELAAGVKVPKDQLHTTRALVECHKNGALDTCLWRVRLEAGETSATQPMPADVAAKIWAYARAARPEAAGESVLLADLICDYIGKKSPPYNVEDVRCVVQMPRATDEAVFGDKAAEEMGEALRGEAAYGTGVVTLNGSIACQWIPGSPRTPCVTRSLAGGVLQEKLVELSAGVSAEAAKALMQALQDHTKLTGGGTKAFAAPSEIAGALTCVVDSAQIESEGRRGYACRAKL